MRQRELREHIRGVVLEQIRPRVRELDENCDYPHDIHETLFPERGADGARAACPTTAGATPTEASWCAYVEELAKISGTVSLMAAYVELVPAADPGRGQRGAEEALAATAP